MITRQPVPPKLNVVNALATNDFPCSGAGPLTGNSTVSLMRGMLGVSTRLPSTFAPLPPKNDKIETF